MRSGGFLLALALALALLGGTASGAETAKRPEAPPIAGKTLDGKKLALASFRGRPVLINVWSSW